MPDPIELLVREALERQQMGNALARDVVAILVRAFGSIAAEIAHIDPMAVSGPYRRRRLDKLLTEIGDILKKADSEQYALAKRELAEIGVYEGERAAAIMSTPKVKVPVHPALMRSILATEPIQGKLLRDWFKDHEVHVRANVARQIRLGVAEHETIDQIVRRVRGRAVGRGKYVGGVMETTTREATAIVRTSVTHIAAEAQHRVYSANEDLTEEYEYSAVLDGRTSDICMGLDGQTFRYDDPQRKMPPQHPNCRSGIVPVLKDDLIKEHVKATGPVKDAKEKVLKGPGQTRAANYEAWLRGLDAKQQDAILGPARARLFRDGKISLRDLVRSDGTSKTVAELRAAAG